MAEMTLEDLVQIMEKCAGEDENLTADNTVANTDFEELGYDSLALMAAATEIEKTYRISLDEDELAQARTLASFADLVNKKLSLRQKAS